MFTRIIPIVLIGLPLSLFAADYDDYTYYGTDTLPLPDAKPLTTSFSIETVAKAKLSNAHANDDHLLYQEAAAKANLVFLYEEPIKEGAYAEFEYNYSYLDWKHNPFFRQRGINTLEFTLGGFTGRLPGWQWIGNASFNIDADHLDIELYATYDFLLWGRYTYRENIGVHVGFYAETGMKINRVYPVLGVDWDISPAWKLNAVFPIDVSLLYTIDPDWTVGIAGRLLNARHRVNKHEPLSSGLWIYRNTGGEFTLNYAHDRLEVNLHAGYFIGGTLEVANRHYKHKHYFDIDPSGYLGGEMAIKF